MKQKSAPKNAFCPKAFSLVELLVVVAIIAILSVTAYTAFGGQTTKARDSRRQNDLSTMQTAFDLYFVNEGRYPATPLVAGSDTAIGEVPRSYLSLIPSDPGRAGADYIYAFSGATFQIAATLEGDGSPENHRAYVIGNSDADLIQAGEEAPDAVEWNGVDAFAPCAAGTDIVNGGTCLPYDPNATTP